MTRGGRRRAERPGGHGRAPLALGAVAVTALVVTVVALRFGPDSSGPTSAEDTAPAPSPSPPTDAMDLSNLPMSRSITCEAVDDLALSTALNGPATRYESYSSGDRVEMVPGVTDVAHENLCGFASPHAEARIWVFAAPVSTSEARRLVREIRATPRCTFPTDAARFGTPGITSVCDRRGKVVATHRGLFGDTWFSCELSAPGAAADKVAVRTRADRWCVHVATTLGARP